MKRLLIDPPSEVNLNLPNLQLAYAATILKARVIDLHALPMPARRYCRQPADQLLLSFRSFNQKAAEEIRARYQAVFPQAAIHSLQGILDVQCCYPFIQWDQPFSLPQSFGDALPFPEFERFDSFTYLRTNWQTGFWSYPLMTSLGCPFSCSFCSARRRSWQPRSAAHSVEELKRASREYGITSFEILDDVFNLNEERVLRFGELVRPLGLSWACVNGLRADLFSRAQAKAMAEAGCRQVAFGIESTSDDLLTQHGKGETLAQIEAAISIAQEFFPVVGGFLILGLPGSTYESDAAAIEWARQRGINACFSYFAAPEPKSRGQVFYGSAGHPTSPAYPADVQQQLYRLSRSLNRSRYLHDHLPGRVLAATWHSRGQFGAREWLNHAYHLAKRAWSVLRTGDLQ